MKIITNANRAKISFNETKGSLAVIGNTAITGTATVSSTLGVTGAATFATTVTQNGTYGESSALKITSYEVNMATATGTGTGTITIANGIPANSVVLGVTSYIDTILAGASLTTWKLGVTSDTDRYHSGTTAIAAGTATSSLTAGASGYTGPHAQAAAINLLMTADAGVFSTGIIHICVHYMTITGPTT